jgi:hypothetical protein
MREMYRLRSYQLIKKGFMELVITKAYIATISFDSQMMPLAFAAEFCLLNVVVYM